MEDSEDTELDTIDKRLFARWRDGDRRAGDGLARRHYARLSRYFARRFHGDVDDLVQRTWLVVIEARARIEQPENFRCFYLGVARNVCREEIRRRVRKTLQLDDRTELGRAPSPAEQLEQAETNARLHEALGQLPLKLSRAIFPYYWDRRPAHVVGELLGIPESTTRSRLRRGKDFLRTRLQ
jgi:RNA polymerase sigma-70 factor (ECF subfamily)